MSFDRKSMQVRPHGSKKDHYEWRLALKEGDKVDYFNDNYTWVNTVVAEVRKSEEEDFSV